jgi:hypothetical protein
VGRFPVTLALASTILVGGVALAQQGLIVDPWRSVPVPAAPARAVAPTPKSGLPATALAPARAAAPPKAEAVEQPTPGKWSPPVVELLVDPWAKERLARPARPSWVPDSAEIIDPWPEPAPQPPRVASLPAKSQAKPIF